MKTKLLLLMCIMLGFGSLCACGQEDSKVSQVLKDKMQEEDAKSVPSEEPTLIPGAVSLTDLIPTGPENPFDEYEEMPVFEGESDVDIDLTRLGSNMVYAEVSNMMYYPNEYLDKTVRMRGMFVVYTNQDESIYYPAIIIADATACCAQGLEFLLEGNSAYPSGYPEVESEATVVGTFETYREDGNLYCRLKDARLE